jgi:hypothetical protein
MIRISQKAFRIRFVFMLIWPLFFSTSAASFYASEIPLDRALDDATMILGTLKALELPEKQSTESATHPRVAINVLLHIEEVIAGPAIEDATQIKVSVLDAFPGTAVLGHVGDYGLFLVRRHDNKWIFASPGEHAVLLHPSIAVSLPPDVSRRSSIALLADANLSSASPRVQKSCLRALWRLSVVPKDMQSVRRLASSSDLETRAYAVWLRWRSGAPGGREALDRVAKDIASNGNPLLFARYYRSLKNDRQTQIAFAIHGLESPSEPLRSRAVDFLRRERARIAIPDLRELLDDDNADMRYRAYLALWETLGEPRDLRPRSFEAREGELIPRMKQALEDAK